MKRLTLVFLLLTAACSNPFGPTNAKRYVPPPELFADLWAQMEQCSGARGNWGRIEWYIVPTDELYLDGKRKLGVWSEPHTIYLAAEVVQHTDGRPPWQPWARVTVMHEMLHDLTGPDHGPVFDQCGVRTVS